MGEAILSVLIIAGILSLRFDEVKTLGLENRRLLIVGVIVFNDLNGECEQTHDKCSPGHVGLLFGFVHALILWRLFSLFQNGLFFGNAAGAYPAVSMTCVA